ncbi:MAG TPA: class II aldolase/adducin family protein [Hyphomicrobiales bacterium]|nr:class II aldolase/adducin family protein [Hyphomicrobiales bacterium]
MEQSTSNRMGGGPPSGDPEAEAQTEWHARVNLAACYRLMAHFGMTDIIHTHISARVPGTENEFLINPYGMLFEEVRASQLVKVNIEGDVLSDPSGMGINRAGFFIHSAVHRARPDVQCVLHAHTVATIAVSAQEPGLLPLSQHAMFLLGGIRYLDYGGFVEGEEGRAEIGKALAGGRILILRNHGPLIAGATAAHAFSLMHYLERACQVQVATLMSGTRPVRPSEPVVRRMENIASAGTGPVLQREWAALRRMLDRQDPTYAS